MLDSLKSFINDPKAATFIFIALMLGAIVIRFGAPAVGITLPDAVNTMLDGAATACFVGAGGTAYVKNTMQKKVDSANEETGVVTSALTRLVQSVTEYQAVTPAITSISAMDVPVELPSQMKQYNNLLRIKTEIQRLVLK